MSSSIASKISIKDKLDITYNILNIIVKSNKNLAGNKYSKKKIPLNKKHTNIVELEAHNSSVLISAAAI